MEEYINGDPVEEMDPSEENLVFHYKKGSFRKREDQSTRDLATGKINLRPGLIKSLVSTKGNRIVFFVMLICIGVTVFLGLFRQPETDVVSGVRCNASAFSFDGNVYATLEMENTPKNKSELPVTMEVLFECINVENAVADKYAETVIYVPGEKQYVRTVFTDYDMKKLRVSLKVGKDEKVLETSVSQR